MEGEEREEGEEIEREKKKKERQETWKGEEREKSEKREKEEGARKRAGYPLSANAARPPPRIAHSASWLRLGSAGWSVHFRARPHAVASEFCRSFACCFGFRRAFQFGFETGLGARPPLRRNFAPPSDFSPQGWLTELNAAGRARS
eukprot:GEMP01111765.1.p1 GENE.GEMP01111765.1~~GEMP01111765.1.p1  ORF type:complete len:146 (-),score=21.07 GEMP01111765.1:12-449(-)